MMPILCIYVCVIRVNDDMQYVLNISHACCQDSKYAYRVT